MRSAGQGLFALRPGDRPWRDPALRRVFTLCLGVVLLAWAAGLIEFQAWAALVALILLLAMFGQHMLAIVAVALLSFALGLHLVPGFHNAQLHWQRRRRAVTRRSTSPSTSTRAWRA